MVRRTSKLVRKKIAEKKLYKNEWLTVKEGVAEGRLIAGNINAMYGFIGTCYFPQITTGDILLIEDCSKSIAIVEKKLCHVKTSWRF